VRIAALTTSSYNPLAASSAATKPHQTQSVVKQQQTTKTTVADKTQPSNTVTKEAEKRDGGGIFSGVLSAVRSTFFSSSGKPTSDSSGDKAPPPSTRQSDQSQATTKSTRVNFQHANVVYKTHSNPRVAHVGVTGRLSSSNAGKAAPIGVNKVIGNAGRLSAGSGSQSSIRGSINAGKVQPSRGRVTPGAGRVTPGAGRVTPGSGRVTPGAGRVLQRATVVQPTSSLISKAQKIAHNIQAPPIRSKQAPPTRNKQAPPTQLNLQGRPVNQRQPPHIKPAPSPNAKDVKGQDSEESTGFFSAVFSSFYGANKKKEPEAVESTQKQKLGTVQRESSTMNKFKIQTTSIPKSLQQKATAVPRQTSQPTIVKTTQHNTRVQTFNRPTDKAPVRPTVKTAARPTVTNTAKTTATGAVRTIASKPSATAASGFTYELLCEQQQQQNLTQWLGPM